jgi:hypothetical protein
MVSACGSNSQSVSQPAAISANPKFTLTEFGITLDRPTISAGTVTLTAKNAGAEEHEIVLVRAASVADLPTKVDGSVDEEKIAASDKMGEIEHVGFKGSKSATFELVPGTYVAFCNLINTSGSMGSSMMDGQSGAPGMGAMHHVHFAEGMHLVISVR